MKGTRHIIGLPCSPSRQVSFTDKEKGTKIKISFGGGMGGANRTIYAKEVKEINKYGIPMLEITPFFGEKEELNPQFIVSSQECRIAIQVVDTSAHSNYRTNGNKTTGLTQFFELGMNDTVDNQATQYVSTKSISGKGLSPIKKIPS